MFKLYLLGLFAQTGQSDCKSNWVTRTLLSIQTDLNYAVVCMVSIRRLLYKSSGSFTDPVAIVRNHNWYHRHLRLLCNWSFRIYHHIAYICYFVAAYLICLWHYYYYYYYLTPLRVFHISVSWWFLTGVWVTAIHLKSSGLFSVFWSLLILL